MNEVQNKIVAFLFLLMVAIPLFLSVKFILEENLIQQEVEEKMNSFVLQSVNIGKTDIAWVRNGKEILIGDKYFDVRDIETSGDVLILTGYFDTEETNLLAAFTNYTEHQNRGNPLNELAFKFLFSTVYNSYYAIVYDTTLHAISNKYYSFDEMLPAAPTLPFVQPPKL